MLLTISSDISALRRVTSPDLLDYELHWDQGWLSIRQHYVYGKNTVFLIQKDLATRLSLFYLSLPSTGSKNTHAVAIVM